MMLYAYNVCINIYIYIYDGEARLKVRATRRSDSKSWKTVQGEPVIGYTKMGWFAAEHGEHDETL